jgi:hypothetical protein
MSHRFVATPHHPKVKYKKKKGLNKKMAYKFAWEFETQIIKKESKGLFKQLSRVQLH